jgi:hypothetical protein
MELIRAIQPMKKPRNRRLSLQEQARNDLVSSDRVLVENWFGRLCSLWKCMATTFRWSEESYDTISSVCHSLTNFHVQLHPLRAEDNDFYIGLLSRYQLMAEEGAEQRSRSQKQYRNRRNARLVVDRNSRLRT